MASQQLDFLVGQVAAAGHAKACGGQATGSGYDPLLATAGGGWQAVHNYHGAYAQHTAGACLFPV